MELDRITKGSPEDGHHQAKENLGGHEPICCRNMTQELEQMTLSWGEAQHGAVDRVRVVIEDLCPIGDEEE